MNDSLGFQAGDELLRLVAQRFRACLRQWDTLARLGGDEFAALLPATDEPGAEHWARRCVDALAEPFAPSGRHLAVGVSIGAALLPQDAVSGPALLQQADLAMYRAKRIRRARTARTPPFAETLAAQWCDRPT
ncbi:MAG TPA: GGDEF domain-containing protein [Chloroflexota bacterium]